MDHSPSVSTPAPRTEFVEGAAIIASDLLTQARQLQDGSVSWGRDTDSAGRPCADSGPYCGRCGEGYFYAALYAATGGTRWREGALRTVAGLHEGLGRREYARDLVVRLGVGLTGVGGMVWALVRVAEMTGERTLIDDAARLASTLTAPTALPPNTFDVQCGAAGVVLGLLALADAGSEFALALAVQWAHRLLDCRDLDLSGRYRAWARERQFPWAGFGHGASGVAHALLQVHSRAPDARLYDAATEAFRFERGVYRPGVPGWPEHGGQPDGSIMTAWCHGAVGIGAARLAAVAVTTTEDRAEVLADLTEAVACASVPRLAGPDNLCCGSLGRIDLMLAVGTATSDQKIICRACDIVAPMNAAILRRAHAATLLRQMGPRGAGLWTGLTGLGYLLLRAADPRATKSILTLL